LLNPYGVWSPARARSDDESTDQHSEFGTAREYNNYWYDDQYGGCHDDPFLVRSDPGRSHSQDKFILSTDGKEQFEKRATFGFAASDHDDEGCEGCAEIYSCPFPICDCCRGSKMHDNGEVADMIRSSSLAIYGRYQILDDHTEMLDECGGDEFQLIRVNERPETVLVPDFFHNENAVEDKQCSESGLPDKELQNNAVDDSNCFSYDPTHNKDLRGSSCNRKLIFVNKMNDEELQKESYSMPPSEEEASKLDVNYPYGFGDYGTIDRELEDSRAVGLEGEDGMDDELQLYNPCEDEMEVFDLRIVHRKNRFRSTTSS
ncbi:hypothetical protein GW17_00046607, partial [Ensete ventricosum]